MSQDHNHLNHATWECKYHVVFTPKYRKKALFGQIKRTSDARPRAYPDIDPAEVFGGGGDRVLEREKLDLDCAECGTQAAQLSWPQIPGEGLLRFDRRAGLGTIRTYIKNQEIADKAVESVATEAHVLIKSHLLYQNPS